MGTQTYSLQGPTPRMFDFSRVVVVEQPLQMKPTLRAVPKLASSACCFMSHFGIALPSSTPLTVTGAPMCVTRLGTRSPSGLKIGLGSLRQWRRRGIGRHGMRSSAQSAVTGGRFRGKDENACYWPVEDVMYTICRRSGNDVVVRLTRFLLQEVPRIKKDLIPGSLGLGKFRLWRS